MSIREQLNASIKEAMIAKDRASLQTLRMLSAALKQIEVDQRIEITDEVAVREFVRQLKQRQDAAHQYHEAGREDLAAQEESEMVIIRQFLPEALSAEEIEQIIDGVIASSGLPKVMSSMGALMAQLKERLEGRADMAEVSKLVRSKLQS